MAGAKNLTRLNVALTVTTGPFSKGLNSAIGDVTRFGVGLKNAILGPLGAITSLLAGGGIAAGIKIAADRIDGLAKSADRLGIATESLAGLRLAADEAGASTEALEGGMIKLQRAVVEAANGNKTAAKSFEDLGLSVSALSQMSADEQFKAVADAISQLDNAGQRTAATLEIFGKSGSDLAGTLAMGSKGLEQATKDAEALGLAVSRIDAAKVEEANDAFGRIGKVGQGVFNSLTVALAPFVTAMTRMFTDWATGMGGIQQVGKKVVDFLVDAAGFVGDTWRELNLIFSAGQLIFSKLTLGLVMFADSAIQSAQWIGMKFQAGWRLIEASAGLLWESLKLGFNALHFPLTAFIQFAAGQFSLLLQNVASVAFALDDKLGSSILNIANSIKDSTGSLIQDSMAEMRAGADATGAAMARVGQSTINLFSTVKTQTSEAIAQIKRELAAGIISQEEAIRQLEAADLPSQSINALVARIQAEADARAIGRANEVAATQEFTAELDQAEMDSLAVREEARIAAEDKAEADRKRHQQAAISGTSSMFGNLAALQESHSKTAQRIGKVAAKAKIVTDTASAAMGAYSAMAGIPIVGPALGIAAAAAAVIAGGVQLSNVDSGSIGNGGGSGPVDTSTGNNGGILTPAAQQPGQAIVIQGEFVSAQAVTDAFDDARERGYMITEVRRA